MWQSLISRVAGNPEWGYKFSTWRSGAAVFHSNLGRFVHSAVVSEVLLFGLHVIYSLLLGSVLQPGDRSTDPLQQLDRKRKETAGNAQWDIIQHVRCHEGRPSYSRHSPASRSPPSFVRSPDWQPALCRYGWLPSQPVRKQPWATFTTTGHKLHRLYSEFRKAAD